MSFSSTCSNLPWEDRPAGCCDIVWRYSGNPVIRRDALPAANSIFNSAVLAADGGFAGVFRIDDRHFRHRLHTGRSDDGIHWAIEPEPIVFHGEKRLPATHGGYDPRLTVLDDRVYMTWANGYHGPVVGLAWTDDLEQFTLLENALPPKNRNGVLLPRKVEGRYALLHRPTDDGPGVFGSIFCSLSPDLVHWGQHRHVMSPVPGWDDTKVGAGPPPVLTDDGWLLLYHGVKTTCNGRVYRMGAALLEADRPWVVLARADSYLLGPTEPYECMGDVPNVVFPCGLLHDEDTGRLAIYYGAADSHVCLAFARIDEVIAFIEEHAVVST